MIYDTDYEKGDWLHEQRRDRKLDELADREERAPLSERIRANSEAAPWVIEEVRRLEDDRHRLLCVLQRAVWAVDKLGEDMAAARETAADMEGGA